MHVWVTRPQPQADATAEKLRAMGHDPVVAPLTEIVPLVAAIPDAADVIAFTSANALRFAEPEALRALLNVPVLAVGDRTAQMAIARGFTDVTSADGDVEALVELAISRTRPEDSILYLCGQPRRPDFEAAMQQSGMRIVVVETYEAAPIEPETLGLGHIDAVLLYSQSSARIFAPFATLFPRAALICMSSRVAEPVAALSQPIIIADRPTEEAMIAALDSL